MCFFFYFCLKIFCKDVIYDDDDGDGDGDDDDNGVF